VAQKRLTLPVVRAIRRLTVRTVLPEPLAPLGELVNNLRWSWHQPTQELFAAVDPAVWDEVRHDPARLLGEVPTARLAELAKDQDFLARVTDVHADLQRYLTDERWYQASSGDNPAAIAYFSPEFGITHVLPQYSGGLGILAGDHLKAASDLGVPIIGVGLLYRQGYFVQSLSREGWQQERYPVVDPDNLPLTLLRESDGTAARIQVGQRVPINVPQAGGGFGEVNVRTENVGVILDITPSVVGTQVELQIRAERSFVEPSPVAGQVIFTTSETVTQITVPDGQTVVISGLTTTDLRRTRTGIPILMNLPLIGTLFRHEAVSEEVKDLLIMVTPHIDRAPEF
jgi:hypothetical protein